MNCIQPSPLRKIIPSFPLIPSSPLPPFRIVDRLSAVVICYDGRGRTARAGERHHFGVFARLLLFRRRYAVSVSMRDMTVGDKQAPRASLSRTWAHGRGEGAVASLSAWVDRDEPPLSSSSGPPVRRCRCSMIFWVTHNIIRIRRAVSACVGPPSRPTSRVPAALRGGIASDQKRR